MTTALCFPRNHLWDGAPPLQKKEERRAESQRDDIQTALSNSRLSKSFKAAEMERKRPTNSSSWRE